MTKIWGLLRSSDHQQAGPITFLGISGSGNSDDPATLTFFSLGITTLPSYVTPRTQNL